jgi:hypothetical protein
MSGTNPAGNAAPRHDIPLEVPVTHQGTTYTKLSLRRPKVKDTRLLASKADKDPIGANNDFIASLAEVPPAVIDELDLVDMGKISDWVDGFTKRTEKP